MTKNLMSLRIEDDLKNNASEVLSRYGLTLSDGIRIFLTSVVNKKGLPPELVMDDAEYERWAENRLQRSLTDRGPSRPAAELPESLGVL